MPSAFTISNVENTCIYLKKIIVLGRDINYENKISCVSQKTKSKEFSLSINIMFFVSKPLKLSSPIYSFKNKMARNVKS
ncbi:hypothetical protein KUTeg_001165 [Tegillarca granosa]|uniref:Uncharacterized protein n=1 Tax=Tegillarca granosa TaxID=220873 RepID=A0ABQ9FVM7_TEGGR|nr:hypothetical protein KUTeg_001165 [Tegillarca granosa]